VSLSPGDQATIIGIGLAALFGLGGGIWKSASLRGDVNVRWARRVDFATAALDDKTIVELERLRDAVDKVLPAKPFDPGQAIADPAPLTAQAERATDLHRARVRMESCVRRLMLVGRITIGVLMVLAVGAIATTCFYAELIRWDPLEAIGLIILAVGIALLVAVGATYIVLQDRLASGEDLAGTAGRAEEQGS
jgi:hypothetical protein